MNYDEISFNEMPKALAHLISKVENLEQLLKLDIPVILTTRFGDIDHPLGCVSLNTMA